MQKRLMNFTTGIEDENSFMIIPNAFIQDRPLTQEDIASFMFPDHEYEQAMTAKCGAIFCRLSYRVNNGIKSLVKRCLSNDPDKILRLKMRFNRLLRRKLPTKWL
ncbi:MAG: hypothetical protein IJT02_09295 [Synergistaceae bacterium]|nr:hypothetical protein [Synergistaceae bacterium]